MKSKEIKQTVSLALTEGTQIYGNIKFGLGGLNESKLAEKGEDIVKKMTGNAYFEAPPLTLLDITAQIAILRASMVNKATDEGKVIVEREKKLLKAMLKKTGYYVGMESDDLVEKILSSGFEVAKTNTTKITVGKVVNVQSRQNDTRGSVTIVWDSMKGAKSYQVRYRKNIPNSPYSYSPGITAAKIEINGLLLKEEYIIEISAVGSGNNGAYSQAFYIIVT